MAHDSASEQSKDPELRVRPPKQDSVGIPGITHSLEYALREMGPRRSLRTLLKLNQTDGFDCPSCAWGDPDPEHRKLAEFCENGAKAVAWEATRKRVEPELLRDPLDRRSPRGRTTTGWRSNGRLTEPMYLAPGSDALRADRVGRGAARWSPSGHARSRIPNARRLLHDRPRQQRGRLRLPAAGPAVRHQQPARLLEHVPRVERRRAQRRPSASARAWSPWRTSRTTPTLILIVGQNPGTNHPRMLTRSRRRSGAGPRSSRSTRCPRRASTRFHNPQTARGLVGPGTQLADRLLPVRVNGDLALFNGLNRALLEREDARARRRPRPRLHRPVLRRIRAPPCPAWRERSTGRTVEAQSGLTRVARSRNSPDEVVGGGQRRSSAGPWG